MAQSISDRVRAKQKPMIIGKAKAIHKAIMANRKKMDKSQVLGK